MNLTNPFIELGKQRGRQEGQAELLDFNVPADLARWLHQNK